ncbi:MAG: T9SS type A sorting domain-containing protein [Bacteroidota bacterium]|nr:T9SS type A sorting domain-containing protein [Bacteroidota bacterium]
MKQTITVFICVLISVELLSAQDGALDITFNSTGKVITPTGLYLTTSERTSMALQADGKIVVAGPKFNGVSGDFDYVVARYNSSGALDNTFGTSGSVITVVSSQGGFPNSIAIQDDGKILVAGFSQHPSTSNDFAVVRYNSNGTLDSTFDSDGKTNTDFTTTNDKGNSVAIQADGKIVVAGEVGTDGFGVVRYNSNGAVDSTFDVDGKVQTNLVGTGAIGRGVAIQADGKIVVAGSVHNGLNYDFALVRYNSNGTLDNTFNFNGIVTTEVGLSTDEGNSVAIQGDGKILVAGSSNNGVDEDFALVRYNTNGTVDSTFDSDGRVTTAFGTSYDIGRSVVIQADGKILVAGFMYNGVNTDFAVVRYTSTGALDSTFDSDAKVTTEVGSSVNDIANNVALQSDGKIVVAGYTYNGADYDFAVVRYTGSSGPLPVELISFTASAKQNGVELKWNTATEVNNYGFEIERAINNGQLSMVNWSKTGFVEGNGTTNSPKAYSFYDKNLSSGKYSYRLKQIDRDGKFSYSQSVEVMIGSAPKEFALIQNYPNPFNPSTMIGYQLSVSSTIKLTVFDVLGREIAVLANGKQEAGNYTVQFDAKNLSGGLYFYQLQIRQTEGGRARDFVETKKMIFAK